MTSSINLKITFQDVKILTAFEITSTTTIKDLIPLILSKLSFFVNTEISIVQLQTPDGFLFSNEDLVSQVLRSGDSIFALDMIQVFTKSADVLKSSKEIAKLDTTDLSDSLVKYASIGIAKNKSIFVKLVNGYAIVGFQIFSISQFRSQFYEKESVICSFTSPTNSHLSVSVKRNSQDSYLFYLRVKAASSSEILVDEVETKLKGFELELVKITRLASPSLTTQEEEEEIDNAIYYSLPKIITQTGPQMNTAHSTPMKHSHKQSVGNSVVQMRLDANESGDDTVIEVNMDHYARDGLFNQYVTIPFVTLFNSSAETVSILAFHVEYFDSQTKEWIKAHRTILGSFRSYGNYSWNQEQGTKNNSVTMEGKYVVTVAIQAIFKVQGTPGDDNQKRARIQAFT